MKVYRLDEMTADEMEVIKRRSRLDIEGLLSTVEPIVEDVRARGDEALLEYTARFDGPSLSAAQLRVSQQEFERAHELVSPEVLDAFRRAARNIRFFHEREKPRGMWLTEIGPGIVAGQKLTPMESVGLYVPRNFPSVMLMLGTCASVAGVGKIVACTPPTPEGGVNSGVLAAAELAEVDAVYRVGGAQAVAAMAFGTETVPKVDKIVGPGSPYVAAAMSLVAREVDVGPMAGPSESIILADEEADSHLVALDLLVQAEHSMDAASLLVTHSDELIESVQEILPSLLSRIPQDRRRICFSVLERYGGAILTKSLAQSVEFVNDYAPEHLQLAVHDPFAVLPRVRHAGTILLGQGTPFTFADFALGPSNVIPTGGFAKAQSPVSVLDFMKRSSLCFISNRAGFETLAPSVVAFAEYEGFPSHARAVKERVASG
ncbi:MAG: histidinol dehydrogenase [Chloroflexota bacterium]|nr:histidinol dehydrogenase [Chloroflexota bacterium]